MGSRQNVGLAIVIVVSLLALIIFLDQGGRQTEAPPLGFALAAGIVASAGVAALLAIVPDEPAKLLTSEGTGAISRSKLQVFIWTFVTVFAYVAVLSARYADPKVDWQQFSIINIPQNVLLLMGFSAATAVTAKGLELAREKATDDKDENELFKVQMIVWTIISAIVYVAIVANFIQTGAYAEADVSLPDVDGALLVLMGVSQAAYLGNKLASRITRPLIDQENSPSQAKLNTDLHLLGAGFGDTSGTVVLSSKHKLEQGKKVPQPSLKESVVTNLSTWGDTLITFQIGNPFAVDDYVAVKVRNRETGQFSDPHELLIQ